MAAAQTGAVDEVVVHERGEVDELDGDAGDHRRFSVRRSGQVDEQRSETFAAGRERLGANVRDNPTVRGDSPLEPVLEL